LETSATPSVSLSDYLQIARQRWLLISLGMLLGLGFGVAWFQLAPRQYEASSVIAISPITGELFSSTPVNQLVNTATESAIARSGEVASRAAEIAGLEGDVRDIQERVSVAVPLNSLVMEISYRATTATDAAAGANAFAESYLEFRASAAERRLEGYEAGLRDQLDQATAALEQAPEGSPEAQELLQRVSALQEEIGQAAAATVTPGQVITFAQEPRYPASPRRLVAGVAGLVLGVLIGVALAGLAHGVDDRVTTVGAAERLSGRRATGVFPPFYGRRHLSAVDRDEIALSVSHLQRVVQRVGAASWLVLSAEAGERTPADILAWELAGRTPTVLIRHPRYPGYPVPSWAPSGFPTERGVEVLTAAGDEAADVIASGRLPVVVDTSGAERFADALAHLTRVGAVVLCVELGRTRKHDLARSLSALGRTRIDASAVHLLVVRRTSRAVKIWRGLHRASGQVIAGAERSHGADSSHGATVGGR
jgi:capsular polysaccharide biosynthesis protein